MIVFATTALGIALPVAGIDFAGDTVARITAFIVLTFLAVLDLGLARFLILPMLRRRGMTREGVESAGYTQIHSMGVTAVLMGLATDIPEAALIPGGIALYGWTVMRLYFKEWDEAATGV